MLRIRAFLAKKIQDMKDCIIKALGGYTEFEWKHVKLPLYILDTDAPKGPVTNIRINFEPPIGYNIPYALFKRKAPYSYEFIDKLVPYIEFMRTDDPSGRVTYTASIWVLGPKNKEETVL